jgi:hypothetical protein
MILLRSRWGLSILPAILLSLLATSRADAQSTVTISMQAPPAAPHIGGAPVIGVRTGAPVAHAVAVTGTRPITFSATGLPAGLSLDAATGRLSGSVTGAGTTVATVTATNAMGSDSRALRIVAGDTVALTPPMGWNSYDSFDDSVTESEMIAQASWVRDTLAPFGWDTVIVDFRWYDPNTPQDDQNQASINNNLVTDANGRMQPATNRFPSAANGMGWKPLADMIHGMGLRFGIHIMRGIPRKSYQADTPIAGSTFTARQAGVTSSTAAWNSDMYGVTGAAGQAWYSSIFQQYAAWGIDFVKVDDAAAPTYHQEEVGFIQTAIAASGRSIVLSLSPGPTPTSAAAHLRANANMWRMYNDFWDTWSALGDATNNQNAFSVAQGWSTTNTGGPGQWPDADMLPLGHLGPRCPVAGANRDTRFSRNEQVLMMSLWALLPSPLMLGANGPSTSDAFFTALLTNEEVIAVNQDDLGAKAKMVVRNGDGEVWSKDLSGGRMAVGLFNRGGTDQTISATLAQLGITDARLVRDAWMRRDAGVTSGMVSAAVPFHAAALLVLSPVSSPADGGTDARTADASADRRDGGGPADALSDGPGGATGQGGARGTGGSPGTGGNGAGGSGIGGAMADAGGGGAGGARAEGTGGAVGGHAGDAGQPDSAVPGGTPAGCGCTVGLPASVSSYGCAVAAALALAARRRRRGRGRGRGRTNP